MDPKLTPADRTFLIKKSDLPPGLRQKLSSSTKDPLNLTKSEITILSAATIKAYTGLNNPKTRKALQQVLTKLLAAGEEIHNPPAPKSTIDKPAVKKAIKDLVATTPNWKSLQLGEKIQAFNSKLNYPTLDQTTEALEILIDHLNREPRPSFGNLSSEQLSNLIHEDWTPATPGIQFRHDLSTREVISTPIIARAQLMLHALAKSGTKATTAGNLNRKFVASMIEQMELPEDYLAYLNRHYKVFNESDVAPVEVTRIVLELADIIKYKKQKFQITPMGRELMEPGYEGGLFLILFVTFFREFNIGFGDRMGDLPKFQDTIAYSLYRLSILKDGWHDLARTSEQLMLPSLAEIVPAQPFDLRSAIVARRLLVHLELFGLVELKRKDDPGTPLEFRQVLAFRKTALLERFIWFRFS